MRKVLLPLLTVAALTGCTSGQVAPCTLMHMDSAVSVIWRPADFEATGGATIRVCVDGACEERASGDPGDPIGRVSVRIPDDVRARELAVALTVTPVDGGRPLRDGAQARPAEERPNGPGCAPVVRTASFRADPVRGLISPEGLVLQGR
ncbi:hypothetical protein ACFWVP_34050 [Streptomyces sp. NPDC058637]|uniref:hypothetical protein n=1 Tax=Streptomyces sp. NPDC058637 TaxID=3346569 RepID=UPI00364EF836